MGRLRRVVEIAGLGMPRFQTPYLGSQAYDDLKIYLGGSNFTINNGVKITGIVIDVFHTHPAVMSDSISLYEALVSFGSSNVEIQTGSGKGIYDVSRYTTDYRHQWLGRLVNEFLSKSSPQPWGFYRGSLTPGELDVDTWAEHTQTGTLYFEKRGWQPTPFVGDTLFWGREALQVTYVNPISPGSIPDYPTANIELRVIKRVYGTYHERHGDATNADEDIEIYYQNPIVIGREMTVWDYDPDADELIWLHGGFLERPSNGDNQHILRLNSMGGTGAINGQHPGAKRAFFAPQSPGDNTGEFVTHKRTRPLKQMLFQGGGERSFLIGALADAIVLASYRQIELDAQGRRVYEIQGIIGSIMGTVVQERTNRQGQDRGALEEILVGDEPYTHFKIDEGSGRVYNTHPFDVVRCLLISNRGLEENKYDVLPDGWGLGLPYERFNHADIDALKVGEYGGGTGNYANLELRSLVIKGGANSENVWEIVSRILKPLLCVLTQDEDGLYTIRTMLDLGPEFVQYVYTGADLMMEGTQYEYTRHDPVREIRFNIARRGLSDSYSGEIRSTDIRGDVGRKYGFLSTDEEVSCLDYGRPGQVPEDWQGLPEMRSLINLCSAREIMRNANAHYYTIRVKTNRDNVGVAQLIQLTHPVLLDEEGNRGFETRRMLTLQHDKLNTNDNAGETMMKVVDLESMSLASQVIAPSWEVSSIVQAIAPFGNYTNGTLDLTNFDQSRLEVGQKVLFHSRHFDPVSATVQEITTVGIGTFKITPGFASNPGTDLIMTLADYDDAWSEDLAIYAWVADNDYELGSNPDEAHKWGF